MANELLINVLDCNLKRCNKELYSRCEINVNDILQSLFSPIPQISSKCRLPFSTAHGQVGEEFCMQVNSFLVSTNTCINNSRTVKISKCNKDRIIKETEVFVLCV